MTQVTKKIWFNTLQAALQSEGLQDTWKTAWADIDYDGTVSYYAKDRMGKCRCITIYRDETGMYERPLHTESQLCSI